MRTDRLSKLSIMVMGVLCTALLFLSGCGQVTPYAYPYHHLTWQGERYTATTSYVRQPGNLIGYWTSYGRGLTFGLFSVPGESTSQALCIHTRQGYLLVIGIAETNREK